jgi:hypothetical protein
VILEAGESAGTFFKRFPRHRQLISNNKVFTGYQDPEVNLRFDWNSLLSDDPGLRSSGSRRKRAGSPSTSNTATPRRRPRSWSTTA